MGHAPMTPEILILDAIGMEADVEIWCGGTANCQEPESQRHGPVKAGFPRSKRDECVSKGSRHRTVSEPATELVAR